MKNTLCAFILMLTGICHSQNTVLWSTSFGGHGADGARSIARTNDGGFVVAGYSFSSGGGHSDLYLVRTDPEGEPIWESTFGGPGYEDGYGVAATEDGGFVTTGYSTSFSGGDRDVYLVKTSSEGIEEWTRSFGGDATDIGRSVVETSDGGFVICGSTQSFGNGEFNMYLIRTDELGHVLWSRTFGGPADDNGRSVATTADGGLLLSGGTGSYGGGNRDIWLIKVDSEGNEEWSTTQGNNSNFDWGSYAVETTDGGTFAVGHGDIHGNALLNMILMRTDPEGQTIWIKRFGNGFYDYGTACTETADGDLLAVGVTKSAEDLSNDAYIVKTNQLGKELWSEVVGGAGHQWVQSTLEVDDGYVVAGATDHTSNARNDVWLSKISNITPHFTATTTTGYAPIEVHFEDQSTGIVSEWRWDFDGDDVVDSHEQHPNWTYEKPGVYTVRLEVSSGAASRTLSQVGLIEVTRNPQTPRKPSGRHQ